MSTVEEVLARWSGIVQVPENQERNTNACSLLKYVNWNEVSATATIIHGGMKCDILAPFTLGAHHMIRAMLFEDGSYWVARLAMGTHDGEGHCSAAEHDDIMRREVDVLNLIKQKTTIAVPRVFAYFPGVNNLVGAPIMFTEFCLGNAVMDLSFDFVPQEYKRSFFDELADAQVQLSCITFDKIGAIIRDKDGNCTIGPLPDIGGPFDTTFDFIKAWAKVHTFQHSVDYIRSIVGDDFEEASESINAFPEQVASCTAGFFGKHNAGPFILKHIDLGQNNIVADDDYHIKGIIDWEHSFAAPLLLAEMPKMLSITPAVMQVPNRGLPSAISPAARLEDRKAYIAAIKRSEQKFRAKPILSGVFCDQAMQEVGAAVRMYADPGVVGHYCKVLDTRGVEEV